MKLLIVTQTVDREDPVLGFFHAWLVEFAKHVERLEVVCLFEGAHDLPAHVTVRSLGKERGPASPVTYALRFAQLAWQLRDDYDAVFVHMNPEYLIIAGPLWKLLGKRTALWYVHKSTSWRLRLGMLFADTVFTASPGSMRVRSRKKKVVGHGIDTSDLPLLAPPPYPPLKLLTVGRISRVKHVDVLIEAVARLSTGGMDVTFTIVGAPATGDGEVYLEELKRMIGGHELAGRIIFTGPVSHEDLAEEFRQAHLFLHASQTGSLDKASLEPLSAGVPVITVDAELAATGISAIIPAELSPENIAHAVRAAVMDRIWERQDVREAAHAYVAERHELARLIERILAMIAS